MLKISCLTLQTVRYSTKRLYRPEDVIRHVRSTIRNLLSFQTPVSRIPELVSS
jgi:hypothetical protein